MVILAAINLLRLPDAKGNTTYFNYDALGRLIKETGPLGQITTYGYDARGNLTSRTDANGNSTIYTYDALGRLLTRTYPDQTVTSFTYNSQGNVITAANQHISYTMEYDTLGRLTKITDSNNRTIRYKYNALGSRIQMTTPDGENVGYSYDEGNRLAQITSFAGSFNFTYDDLGRRTSLTHPNGVSTSYKYDSPGRLVELLTQTDKGKIVSAFTYTHDNIGNRLSKTVTNKPDKRSTRFDYDYDAIYRLLEAVPTEIKNYQEKEQFKKAEIFEYDPVGNRLSGPKWDELYSYNDDNQLLESSEDDYRYDYQYDKNGNLIGKTKLDDDDQTTWNYEYDYDNRLIKVTRVEEDEIKLISFKYDPFGRRIEKRVEEIEEGEVEIKVYTYVYDNEDIILEYLIRQEDEDEDEKTELTRYIHGPGIDEPLAIEQKGKLYFYHTDGLGSIVSLTDIRSKVVQSYEYTSFGELKKYGGKVKNSFTFTGREWDKETGLYFYRARYYDPETGRFITKDPIGFAGGDVNLYGYVSNNPVNFVDPWGLNPSATTWAGVGIGTMLGGPGGGVIGGVIGLGIGIYAGQQIWDNWFANKNTEEGGEQCDVPTTPPDGLVENPNRPGSWGEIGPDGKFKERWRRDQGRPGVKSGHGSEDHIHVGDRWYPIK